MRSILSVLLITVVFVVSPASAQKRNITERDLFNFVWVGDPQISPDGSRVAFVRVTVNDKKDGYDTSIWTVSTVKGETHQLTTGTRDSSPRWSPDGKYVVFVRVTEKDGKPEVPQLFMLAMAGGDSFQFTNVARGAGQPQWSPDGKAIAFVNTANTEDLAKLKDAQKEGLPNPAPQPALQQAAASPAASPGPSSGPPTVQGPPDSKKSDDKRETDVRVITRAVYRFNGPGYLDSKHPQHIWVIAAPRNADEKVSPKQLTNGRFAEDNVNWAKDSSQIYFTSDRRDEPYYELPSTDIYSVAVSGGQPVKVTSFEMDAGGFALSPNGKQFAFIASIGRPVKSYQQPDLWVMDIAPNALNALNSKPRNLTSGFDYDVGGGLTGDNTAPRGGGGNSPVWAPDGHSIIGVYVKEGRTNLATFDVANGKLTDLTRGNQAVTSFRSTADGSKLVYTVSTPTLVGDLYLLERSGVNSRQLTNFNEKLFSDLNLTEPEEIWYQSFDGKKIQAWVQKPPDFDANKKYPLILNIHGGPHAAYGFIFDHEFQWMAAKGYVVLYPNPRGSTSYGQEFGNIIQYNYPGDDHKDLMAGVDELIKRGYIDEKRLGITGGSGGGVLTNWAIGHTTRFAAAVSQRDISDWSSWWYTADFTQFQPNWFKGAPFEDPDFKTRSPITYIDKVTTPLMLILGEADWRTPTSAGGEQMFRALKYRKIPTVMVRFPNESHELSRSGQPWHRIERLQHIVGWFDKWLMGVAKPEYEVSQ
ncbi:MAG: S9 family peptidase [Acidobacteriota bacterium]|nr:S9 family peptidase [Acidobacteriota bacterium]